MSERVRLNGKHNLPVPVERVMLAEGDNSTAYRFAPSDKRLVRRRFRAAFNDALDRFVNKKQGVRNIHVFAEAALRHAIMGDAAFAKLVVDQVDGPLPSKVEVTGADGEPIKQINLNMSLQEAAEVYRQMLKREQD